MHAKFRALIDALEPKHRALVAMAPVKYASLAASVPERGIYLFSEGAEHLYVGRTNGLRRRLANHCRPSSNANMATFAFRLAREATDRRKATYKTEGSRTALLADPVFAEAFKKAKLRVARCDIRFVEEDDPTRQALLEIYVATVLGTEHNDFDNH